MKKRSGFVSNSSSASFIINFSSEKSWTEIEHYIYNCDEGLINRWNEHKTKTYNWSQILKNKTLKEEEIEVDGDPRRNDFIDHNDGKYSLYADTTMFNDWTDIIYWKFIRALSEDKFLKIKLDSIIQTIEEYDDCNKEVKFNKVVWEYGDMIDRPDDDYYKKMSNQEKQEIIKEQYDIDMSYKEYIADMGVVMTEEEVLEIAKYKLNQ